MLLPLLIALLELKRYVVNRGELAFSIALPVALFALMYGAFGGESDFHATAHIVDLDGGVHSRGLVDRLDALDEISVRERSPEDATAALERSAILTAVVIPSGFSQSLDAGQPTSVVIRRRGNGGETGQIVAGIVAAAAREMEREVLVRELVSDALADGTVSPSELEQAVREVVVRADANPPVRVKARGLADEQPDVLHRLVPGLVVMFLMFAVTLGAQTLVEERRIGTLERLMTTRLSVNQLFFGKFLSGVLRAELQALVLLSLAFTVLRIGSALDFGELLVISAFVAAAVSAVGLVIGAAARTRDQAVWTAVVFTMFMTVFGGTFFDVGSDGPLALLARFTLNRYAIESMVGILSMDEGLAGQVLAIGMMAGVVVVGLIAARVLFRVSEGGR